MKYKSEKYPFSAQSIAIESPFTRIYRVFGPHIESSHNRYSRRSVLCNNLPYDTPFASNTSCGINAGTCFSVFQVVFLCFHLHRWVFLQTCWLDVGSFMSIRFGSDLSDPHFVLFSSILAIFSISLYVNRATCCEAIVISTLIFTLAVVLNSFSAALTTHTLLNYVEIFVLLNDSHRCRSNSSITSTNINVTTRSLSFSLSTRSEPPPKSIS